jgi:hypothetical protein
MAFQFYCPQRHLLEATEAQTGQQSQCPICGTAFMIPAPPVSPVVTPPSRHGPPPLQPPTPSDVFRDLPAPGLSTAEVDPIAAMRSAVERVGPTPAAAPAAAEPREELVHLFCPNGHELETPTDMLGQDALCPHCRAQFRLRMRDTREFKAEQLRNEQDFNRKALRWAIGTAVVVGLGLLAMALYTVLGKA